ncbi:hypothetical protein WKY82_05335 [Gordonia malaquae]|uniref:hypothetical protein n=1 Tax=Gordonia malaquae TaxID=410332 RepID=UPI0030C7A029
MSDQAATANSTAKTGQEQAVAAWIDYLNQARLDRLIRTFRQQDVHLAAAVGSINDALLEINKVVASNRGGTKGMHGFIAEVAEVGIGNARDLIVGQEARYEWVDDNGPIDLLRSGVGIQQKFYAAGGRFGLGAVAEHFARYPDYIANGNRYQIPKDHYETIRGLLRMSEQDASALSRSAEGPSFRDWKRVQEFFANGAVPFESLEPAHLDYREVQQGTYRETLQAEEASVRRTYQTRRDAAHMASRPSIAEAAKATGAAAAVEGSAAFITAVLAKRRAGTKLSDFAADDWAEISEQTGVGFATGGVRGLSVYVLTNFTASPAAVANAVVTAGFGIAEQANRFRCGEISEVEFIENAETVALEASVSAVSSLIGQAIVPVPVVGTVIGNTVGMLIYRTAKESLSTREAAIIAQYLEEQRTLRAQLTAEHQELIDELNAALTTYLDLLERAFSPDIGTALAGSIDLARVLGVSDDEILDSDDKTLDYFLL